MKIKGSAQERICRSLLEHGPASPAMLADRLQLTSAAIRKQLDNVLALGWVASHIDAPFGPRSNASRGRGRPAKFYALTAEGRARFESAYESVALEALRMLRELGGPEAFRRLVAQQLEAVPEGQSDLASIAQSLSDLGYAAEVLPAPVGDGVQLCQRNCPVGHAAVEFPELCEAETELLSDRLGRHLTRISTISSGADICTLHVSPRRTA